MVFAERAFVVQDGGIFLLVDTFVGNFCYVESRYVQFVETLKLRKEAVICILRIPMSSPISTWIPSKAFCIFFWQKMHIAFEASYHAQRFFFPFTASGCYFVFIKAKLCSFSFKISLQRAQHVHICARGGTRCILGWGGAARLLISWPCVRQKSLIFLPCLRQNFDFWYPV